MSWPWRLNDTREHGWHLKDGRDAFGPLPAEVKLSPSAAQKVPEVEAARIAIATAKREERKRRLIDPWRVKAWVMPHFENPPG